MKTIAITDFDLTYDGMYFISWENRKYRVYLDLGTLLKMLRLEGLSNENAITLSEDFKPLHFSKVTMTVQGEEDKGKLSLLTSEFSEEYLGKKDLTMVDIELAE